MSLENNKLEFKDLCNSNHHLQTLDRNTVIQIVIRNTSYKHPNNTVGRLSLLPKVEDFKKLYIHASISLL